MLAHRLLGDAAYSNKPAARFFSDCYDIRSTFVHQGAAQKPDLHERLNEMWRFAGELILASIATPLASARQDEFEAREVEFYLRALNLVLNQAIPWRA